jgi:type VI secretion system protein ImpC
MPDAIQPQDAGGTPAPIVAAGAGPAGDGGLLDRIVSDTRMARDEAQRPYAKDLVSEFVGQVLDQGMKVGWDTVASVKDRIAQIDALLSAQVNEILHNNALQTLEASWRGLQYLVSNTETGPMLKLRLLNITKKEVGTDMEKAPEFDQSVLFKRVYEDEYGTFGGNPYSILVGDFEFGRNSQDIRTLELLSNVAAAAHAPFISSASPKLFDWDSFTEMSGPRDLSKGFESA